MHEPDALDQLLDHLERSTRLSRGEAVKVVAEVVEFFSATVEEFVARRHAELQADDQRNDEIFARIQSELRARRFAAPPLSERQIRRLVYG
jgi:hypothetical protein